MGSGKEIELRMDDLDGMGRRGNEEKDGQLIGKLGRIGFMGHM
jgi:hypothetical protein